MRGLASIVTMGILSVAAPAKALDAAGVDVIGLRLGMPEAEAVAAMRRQGFAVARNRGALSARTRDGQLTVDLDGDQAVRQVRYVFAGHGAGEQEKIRDSILDRFGPSDQASPMAWCRAVRADGICPADAATLTFRPENLTLVLRAGTPPRQ